MNEENKCYNEIEHYIKRYEINKKAREISTNYEQVETAWHIGRLLVEAQGGQSRAKYGNELIKEWSKKLTNLYGKGYDTTNLRKFRSFFLLFPKCAPLGLKLTWSHYRELLPIKDETKRNYYINLCIEKNLSKRALIQEIKANSYERLLNKPEHIEIISNNNYELTTNMHNPIILKLNKDVNIINEKDLEFLILTQLTSFFNQLGNGYSLVGIEYKLTFGNRNYYVDMLLFNINMNCYIVVELKIKPLKKEDKGQVEFYMNLVDKNIKKPIHNKTIGLIITKEQDKLVANFVSHDNNIIPLTYELQKGDFINE